MELTNGQTPDSYASTVRTKFKEFVSDTRNNVANNDFMIAAFVNEKTATFCSGRSAILHGCKADYNEIITASIRSNR